MKSKHFITLFIILFFISCKEEKREKETQGIKEMQNEYFSVQLDVVCPKKDNFVVYFTEDNTLNYNEKNTVWAEINGTNEPQRVIFNLKEEVLPTDIRLDFGINKEQNEITLINLEMSYYGNSFQIKGSDFLNFYNQNDFIKTEIDSIKGTIKFTQKSNDFHSAFFYPNEKLLEEIAKITR